jgi:hypothetical protein
MVKKATKAMDLILFMVFLGVVYSLCTILFGTIRKVEKGLVLISENDICQADKQTQGEGCELQSILYQNIVYALIRHMRGRTTHHTYSHSSHMNVLLRLMIV